MPTLREMALEYRELLDAVEYEDGQEVVVPATGEVVEGDEFLIRLYALEGDIERKVDGCCSVVKELEAAGAQLREIEQRYAARRRTFEKKIEFLRQYLATQMEAVKRDKVKTLHFTVYFSPVSQELVVDAAVVPQEFLKPPSPPPVDRMKLKKAVKDAGGAIPGLAHFEPGSRSLVIRS